MRKVWEGTVKSAFCVFRGSGCERCQNSTGDGVEKVNLRIEVSDAAVRQRFVALLESVGLGSEQWANTLYVTVGENRMEEASDALLQGLTPSQIASARGTFLPFDSTCLLEAWMMDGGTVPRPMNEVAKDLRVRGQDRWVREVLDKDGHGLRTVFHPIIAAQTGMIFGYEALVRAQHPDTGATIGATPLIDACLRLELQHVLDQQARRTSIRNAATLSVSPSARFFINFMPSAIYDPEVCLLSTMQTAAECGIPLNRLVFEVVETEHIPDLRRLRRILEYYRSHGACTAVDDLGSGFASLNYITALLPDYVKLDRQVITNAVQSAPAHELLRQMVGCAHDSGAKVIAEGIETVEQMMLCREVDVDLLQGFLFAQPANPPEEVSYAGFDSPYVGQGTNRR